jgi:hypothetical protein
MKVYDGGERYIAPQGANGVAAVDAAIGGNISTAVATLMKGAMFMVKVIREKAVAAIIASALAVGFAGVCTYQKAWGQKPPEALTPVANPAPPAPAAPRPRNPLTSPYTGGDAFGPIRTMTISSEGDPSGKYYGDLDTGKVYDPTQRRGIWTNGESWLSTQGFDLGYLNAPAVRMLIGFEMTVGLVRDGLLEEATPTQLLNMVLQAGPTARAEMPARVVPATYYFRTREGGVGILQLAKINADGSTIEVRYKVLDPKVRDALVAQVVASGLLPDLETQLRVVGRVEAENAKDLLPRSMKNLAFRAASLAEFTRGTPWAARTHLVASTAQLAADLIEQPIPGLKVGTQEIRQALATVTDDINKAAVAAASQPADHPATGGLP